ncbi:34661_t:CDS:2 [Gigaspora margarita]|uniref:34661_t:CDS:1 n=1 Tax=Gigaspora margarita TaxID=4874 RepID=A0ABN7V8S7_GIGMA|nr:34661_t:CDS:2 [Gigaspora margarita]
MSTEFLNMLFQTSSLERQDLPLTDELAATTLLEYQVFTLIDESDIPFFHCNNDIYLKQCDRQNLPSGESLDNSSLDGDIMTQTEQERRAEIKDAFEELRKQLPTTYTGRKMSKAVLLQKDLTTIIANSLYKAVSHIKNQSRKMSSLLDEFNRLNQTCAYLNEELEKKKR